MGQPVLLGESLQGVEEPWPDGNIAATLRQRPIRLHECLLDHVPGIGRNSFYQIGSEQGDLFVLANQRSVRLGITATRAIDQRA